MRDLAATIAVALALVGAVTHLAVGVAGAVLAAAGALGLVGRSA